LEMKKLLISISLMLVFGITSAAISFGRGSFESSGSGGASGGGGSSEMAKAPRNLGGPDGGSYSASQSFGSSIFSGGFGRFGEGSPVTSGGDQPTGLSQGNGLSFDGWLQKSEEQLARRTAPVGHSDDFGDSSRQAYSPQAPTPQLSTLGFSGPGSSRSDRESTQNPTVFLETVPTVTTPVPEPETYAMLLAGLGLIGVVARRRNAAQSD
jgi:hypothetical protein